MMIFKIAFCILICVPFIIFAGLLFEKTVEDAAAGTHKKVKRAADPDSRRSFSRGAKARKKTRSRSSGRKIKNRDEREQDGKRPFHNNRRDRRFGEIDASRVSAEVF